MRILNLIPNLSDGGAQRQLSYIAPELAKRGHEVHVVYLNEGPGHTDLTGVYLHKIKTHTYYNPVTFIKIQRLIHQIRPEIIQTWLAQMDILGGVSSIFNRIPWILREQTSPGAYHKTWKYKLRDLLGSCADSVIANSKEGENYWLQKLPPEKRYTVLNGLPLEMIDNACLSDTAFKKDIPLIMYAGRLIPSKNVRYLILAIKEISSSRKVKAVICGDGPLKPELEKLTMDLKLESVITFTGFLPVMQIWGIMKNASAFISLSEYEGCPNTVMEAMATNCPLIVSDIPAHRELLDETTAAFTKPFDVAETCRVINLILDNPASARERSLAAQKKASQWTVNTMAVNYERIYKQVLDKKLSKQVKGL